MYRLYDRSARAYRYEAGLGSWPPWGTFAALNMGSKRFRTQRLWHNTLIMVWTVPFLVLPGIIVGASSGDFRLFLTMIIVAVLGVALAARRDSRKSATYMMEDDRLVLYSTEGEREIMIEDVLDASLLDRVGARAYLKELTELAKGRSEAELREEFMRFCTVDIGFSTITLGAARRLIDRLPSAKRDLLLLRLRNGGVLLLSPLHAQDMVDTLGRRKLQL